MKTINLLLSIFITILSLPINAQLDTSNLPIMTFKETVHDWGTINEGDVVNADFVFTNTGKSPLIITKIKGSCGCTIPSNWPKEPIMPGATSQFSVKFNSKGKPNRQQKTVTITCNTANGRETVKIKALVTPNPEMEIIRAERIAKRKQASLKRKQENDKLVSSKKEIEEKKEKAYNQKKSKLIKQEKKNDKLLKKTKKNTKRAEKERKKAEKAAKRAKKERKKIEKAASKRKKLQSKLVSAEKGIKKNESKISKMQRKLDSKRSKGKLSPEDIIKRETAIQKLKSKVVKQQSKLKKIKRKL